MPEPAARTGGGAEEHAKVVAWDVAEVTGTLETDLMATAGWGEYQRVNVADRAGIDAGSVLGADARFRNYVCHRFLSLFNALVGLEPIGRETKIYY